jgi:CubicO group peptidase (beta-lactamase class C family)
LALATPEDFVAWLDGAGDWVEAKPGERWFYLNEGYILLGGIIEKLTGLPFPEYVRTEILLPLEMTASGFLGEDLPELATPYVVPTDGPAKPGKVAPIAIGSDGALVSTVLDLAKYVSLWLREGAPLLRRESYEELTQPRASVPTIPVKSEPVGPSAYALGLSVQRFYGRALIGHGGSVLVYTAYLGFIPEERVGVAVLANGSGYPMGQLAQAALAFLLDEDWEDLPFVRLEELRESIFGSYATYQGTMRARVVPRGGAVELVIEDRETPQSTILTLEEVVGDEARFRAHFGDRYLPVVFRLKKGEVDLLHERYKLRRTAPLA